MDWYSTTDTNGVISYTWDPDLTADNAEERLGEGQSYVGVGFFHIETFDPFRNLIYAGDTKGNVTLSVSSKLSSEGFHTIATFFGNVPVAGDAVDALDGLLFLAEGDYENASYCAFAMIPLVGSAKPTISMIKKTLKEVHKTLGGSLPKFKKGKWGSPQRGSALKGYRLDPPHTIHPNSAESMYHINYWDWTRGKKGKGGIWGSKPIK